MIADGSHVFHEVLQNGRSRVEGSWMNEEVEALGLAFKLRTHQTLTHTHAAGSCYQRFSIAFRCSCYCLYLSFISPPLLSSKDYPFPFPPPPPSLSLLPPPAPPFPFPSLTLPPLSPPPPSSLIFFAPFEQLLLAEQMAGNSRNSSEVRVFLKVP